MEIEEKISSFFPFNYAIHSIEFQGRRIKIERRIEAMKKSKINRRLFFPKDFNGRLS